MRRILVPASGTDAACGCQVWGIRVWNKSYLKRLQKELPLWVERGWVTPAGQPAILQHLATSGAGTRRAPLAFAILGVLLLGTGVILFFAANWDGLAKLTKLVILFGAMWAAYLAAAYALARPDRVANGFAQALLLLGTILFGANINLIAQIYHISGHYPNAILLWSLGALAVAWLVRSEPAAVLGLLLLTLWSGMEIFDFGQRIHWPFVVVWALFLPVIYAGTWRFAAGTAMLALLVWGVMVNSIWDDFFGFGAHGGRFLMTEISFLIAGALLLIGVMMEWRERLSPLAVFVERFSIIGALLALHALTVRDWYGTTRWYDGAGAGIGWKAAVLAALAVVIALGAVVLRRNRALAQTGVVRSGQILLAAIAIMIVGSLFVAARPAPQLALYIGFNLLYYACLLWLIYVGYRRGDAFRVNIGFVFFVLGVLVLYFDTLWTLMDRSFFFIGGGVLLCVGGYVLEAQRRRLVARFGPAGSEGDAA